ncbi:hypothetical protein Bca52824_095829 [Brassica carinata]|uniref:Uncharacterized protein n=1 Tax=Brassica carinata TaxID=52824 RepID=A0A8X7P0N9_BRACI|nr:hypothetical protein Bca52824_095829 [Brassica carinata]
MSERERMEMDEDMEMEEMVFELGGSISLGRSHRRSLSPPSSAFVTKLLLGEEIPGDMTEAASTKPEDEDFTVHGGEKDGGIYHHPYLNKTGGNGMRFGAFSSQQAHNSKKVPNQPIYIGPTVSNHKHNDNKPKFRVKPSVRPTKELNVNETHC